MSSTENIQIVIACIELALEKRKRAFLNQLGVTPLWWSQPYVHGDTPN